MNSHVSSTLLCGVITASFFLPFYVWRPKHPRNHPKTIAWRAWTVLGSCLAASVLVYHYLGWKEFGPFLRTIGLSPAAICHAWIKPLSLTVLLFAGPLTMWAVDKEDDYPSAYSSPIWRDPVAWRNLVFAPVTEEFLFRGLIIPVLLRGGYSTAQAILMAPLFFGMAHLHHLHDLLHYQGVSMKIAIPLVAFQFIYTTLFGWLAAVYFTRQQSLVAAVLPHCFCNVMGFPDIGRIAGHHFMRMIVVAYIGGILGFLWLFQRML